MSNQTIAAIDTILKSLGYILGVLITYLIHTHVKNAGKAGALERLTHYAGVIVGDLEQTVVDGLKSTPGGWTKASMEHVAGVALLRLKDLAAQEIAQLKASNQFLAMLIESAVGSRGSLIEVVSDQPPAQPQTK